MVTQKQDHPYMAEYLEAPLRMHKYKLECLQKRMTLMPEGKTDYEKNEVILEKIKTGGEIKALSNIIAEREGYYLNYWQKSFLPDIEDLENNMQSVLDQANKRSEPEIKDMAARLAFVPIGNINIEGKIMMLKQLRNMLKAEGAPVISNMQVVMSDSTQT